MRGEKPGRIIREWRYPRPSRNPECDNLPVVERPAGKQRNSRPENTAPSDSTASGDVLSTPVCRRPDSPPPSGELIATGTSRTAHRSGAPLCRGGQLRQYTKSLCLRPEAFCHLASASGCRTAPPDRQVVGLNITTCASGTPISPKFSASAAHITGTSLKAGIAH